MRQSCWVINSPLILHALLARVRLPCPTWTDGSHHRPGRTLSQPERLQLLWIRQAHLSRSLTLQVRGPGRAGARRGAVLL